MVPRRIFTVAAALAVIGCSPDVSVNGGANGTSLEKRVVVTSETVELLSYEIQPGRVTPATGLTARLTIADRCLYFVSGGRRFLVFFPNGSASWTEKPDQFAVYGRVIPVGASVEAMGSPVVAAFEATGLSAPSRCNTEAVFLVTSGGVRAL